VFSEFGVRLHLLDPKHQLVTPELRDEVDHKEFNHLEDRIIPCLLVVNRKDAIEQCE
jgi:hypothetical protein